MSRTVTQTFTKFNVEYRGTPTTAYALCTGYVVHLGHGERQLVSATDPDLVVLGDAALAAAQREADGPLWMRACVGSQGRR